MQPNAVMPARRHLERAERAGLAIRIEKIDLRQQLEAKRVVQDQIQLIAGLNLGQRGPKLDRDGLGNSLEARSRYRRQRLFFGINCCGLQVLG